MAGSPASAAENKLQYFEGEVRKLESQLTQQKVSYERQIKLLQKEREGNSA